VLPSEQLALMRAQTKAAGILKDLKELAAAWEEVAKKCDLACEEMVKLRLDVERDLGAQLAQSRQTWLARLAKTRTSNRLPQLQIG
jgi:hypothetical protein